VIYRGISFALVVVIGWTLWLWTRHGQRHARDAPVDRTPRRRGRATVHGAPATAPLAATTGQDG
jgi:hypothetical protein